MKKYMLPRLKLIIEKWKWNEEYEIYVSTLGNIKDIHKKDIKPKMNSKGYFVIDTKYGIKSVHKIVLFTFRPIMDSDKLTVDHKNNNKRDNRLENLEWVTSEVNQRRATDQFIDKVTTEEFDNNKTIYISNLDEGVAWVLESQGIGANKEVPAYSENIRRKIKNAINNNNIYCGKRWRYKN